MRFVARPADSEPGCLSQPGAAIRLERRDAARHYFRCDPRAEGFKAYEFKAYRRVEVRTALDEIFRYKCAYCERDIRAGGDGEIEHFRPKGGVEGEAHTGYWWLAHSWTNLLPSCQACNQRRLTHVLDLPLDPDEFERLLNVAPSRSHGKKNYFPVTGKRATHRKHDLDDEQPLLIDPTIVDPANHMTWHHAGSQILVMPKMVDGLPDPKGQETIKACALNRVALVHRRTAALKVLRLQRTRIMDRLGKTAKDDPEWERAMADALSETRYLKSAYEDDQEFMAMTRAFVEDFEAELEEMGRTAALPAV